MTGSTYREACLLQSALLRQRARRVADSSVDAMDIDELIDVYSELQELQNEVHELQEFLSLLDNKTVTVNSLRVGLPS